MSGMQYRGGNQHQPPGGIVGYPLDRIYEEVAFIAYYLHWPHDSIINFPHKERQRWCREVGRINKQISKRVTTEHDH